MEGPVAITLAGWWRSLGPAHAEMGNGGWRVLQRVRLAHVEEQFAVHPGGVYHTQRTIREAQHTGGTQRCGVVPCV